MKPIAAFCLALFVFGCNTTTPTSDNSYQHLDKTDGEIASPKWDELNRFPPLYPIQAAKKRKQGCATIEYVVTPDYQIKDMKVIESTSRYFAQESMNVISKWKWSDLPADFITEPVKTQTRFEFCLRNSADECSKEELQARNQCSGTDVVSSVGSVIKKSRVKKSLSM